MEQDLTEWLFKTKAIKIAPADKPFWYTSGTLGPIYINTHYLYGGEEKAVHLLNIIDGGVGGKDKDGINRLEFHRKLNKEILNNYNEDDIFHSLINKMTSYITEKMDIDGIDYISGGERRDWFFSMPVAKLLNKRHITIFKDLSMVIYGNDEIHNAGDLKGAKILHVADLVTEASSYERAWIPAIKSANGRIASSLSVIDRDQGGFEVLRKNNIDPHSLCKINFELFVKAAELGCLDDMQYAIIKEYLKDPDGAMKKFINENPDFINNAVNGNNKKDSERAKLCVQKGFYT